LRLTYIMPFARVNGKVPLEKLVGVGLKLPKDVRTNLDNLSIRFVVPAQEAGIDVLIERKVKKDGSGEEAVFLVLSYERIGRLPIEDFSDCLDHAAKECRDLFKNLTADS